MSDLISRKAILKHIEKIRQGVQMMDDTRRASIIMQGMYLCEKAVMNQPSEPTCNQLATDCISRQAAIDALSTPHGILYPIRTVEALPSAQPEPRWIPCSERLPDDVEIGEEYPTVIFCTEEGTVHVGGYEHYLGGKWWYMETWEAEAKGVIAWMPLPEAWRGEEHGV